MLLGNLEHYTTRHHNQWRHCNYLPKPTHVSASLAVWSIRLILVCKTKWNETKRNEIYGVGRKNAYYPKHCLRQHWRCVWKLMLVENDWFLPISQSSCSFARITILRNGVFSLLFSKYVLFVRNKMCPPIKWSIFLRVWSPLILLTVLELVSQSSNFARITILRNGVFSLFFSKYVLFVRSKVRPLIKSSILPRALSPLTLLTLLELVSQSSNFAKFTILQNGVFSHLFSKYVQRKIASVHSFRQTFCSCRESNYL